MINNFLNSVHHQQVLAQYFIYFQEHRLAVLQPSYVPFNVGGSSGMVMTCFAEGVLFGESVGGCTTFGLEVKGYVVLDAVVN